jgi:SAM-dependent methyltransferase
LTHKRIIDRNSNTTAASLRDVFGWNLAFAPGNGLIDGDLEDAMLSVHVFEHAGESLRSNVRWSTLSSHLLVHSGFPTDEADAVFFGPDTYRFVSSIEQHLSGMDRSPRRVVDIGCGTGAAAIVIAGNLPNAEVLAVDVNPMALDYARVNIALAGLQNISVLRSDVLNDVDGQFDLIVANPPYMIDTRQRVYRDGGGTLGVSLSIRIARESIGRLAAQGSLMLYTGVAIMNGHDPFRAALQEDLDCDSLTWTYRELDPDVFGEELSTPEYARVERIAVVELIVIRER